MSASELFTMNIGFVFTNYNNSRFTREAVQSILANKSADSLRIVIVDNASEPGDIENLRRIAAEFPEIHVIFNPENSGYFKGLNIGISILRELFPDVGHLVVGNNDLVFPPTFVEAVHARRGVFKEYPVVCPDLVTLGGAHQNPHVVAEISKARELMYDLYFSSYLAAKMIAFVAKATRKLTERKDYRRYQVPGTIYQGYGACYILGPLFLKHFGLLWAPTFLMGEEFFLSKQLQDKGYKLYYEPAIVVQHHDHASVGNVPVRKMWCISRDSHRVYRKYVRIFR